MPITDQEFLSLCQEFDNATRAELDQAERNNTCSLDPLDDLKAVKNMAKPLFAIASMAGKAAVYGAGQYLPERMGGKYCKDKLNAPVPVKYDLAMTEGSTALMLDGGFTAKDLAEKLPNTMKTRDALDKAKEHRMPAMASVIEASL